MDFRFGRWISDCAITVTNANRLKIIIVLRTLPPNTCKSRGLALLVTNYHNRTSQIDLILIDDQTLIFVAIKQRRDNQFDRSKESVGMFKQAKLRNTTASYLQCNDRSQFCSCRFDVVAIAGSPHAPVDR